MKEFGHLQDLRVEYGDEVVIVAVTDDTPPCRVMIATILATTQGIPQAAPGATRWARSTRISAQDHER